MSRVGNNPITIPEGVSVEITDNKIIVKGKLGEIKQEFSDVIVKMNDGNLNVERTSEAKDHKSKHGLYRALINNMVIGVSEGWTKELELVGVGYRASAQGQKLELALGFSHSIVMSLANEVKVETISEKGKKVLINYFTSPYLATAGSGDVLAGLIGSFMSQGLTAIDAACSGCFIHSNSAINLNRTFSSMDLIRNIPFTIRKYSK